MAKISAIENAGRYHNRPLQKAQAKPIYQWIKS